MSISFSGLASGLDTSSWVESLVALKKAKVTSLQTQVNDVEITRAAVNDIKNFFTTFQASLEKLTDAKFSVDSIDLFMQNIANTSDADVFTAIASTEAKEGSYKIVVEKLASYTAAYSNYSYTTTYTETTTATENSTLTSLGVRIDGAASIGVKVNGVERSLTLSEFETIGSFVDKLSSIGVDASYNEDSGIFSVNLDMGDINDIDGTGIVNALGLVKVNEGYQSEIWQTQETQDVVNVATLDTTLAELGRGTTISGTQQVIVENSSGDISTFNVTGTTKLSQFIANLQDCGLYANLTDDGILEISGGNIIGGSFDSKAIFGLEENPVSAMVTGQELTTTIIVPNKVELTTKLVEDLNVSKGYLEITNPDGDVYYEKIYSGMTISDLITDLGNLGINAKLDAENGILTITGGTFDTLTDAEVVSLCNENRITEPDANDRKGTNLLSLLGLNSDANITVSLTRAKSRAMTYTKTAAAVDSDVISDFVTLPENKDITVHAHNGDVIGTISIDNNTTFEELFSELSYYGIDGDIHDGVVLFSSDDNKYLTGDVISAMGVDVSYVTITTTTTVGTQQSTQVKKYTETDVASEDNKLSDYGLSGTLNIKDKDGNIIGTYTAGENDTFADMFNAIAAYGMDGDLNEGRVTFVHDFGGYVDGTLATALGVGTSYTTVITTTTVGTTTTGTLKQYTSTDLATDDNKLSDFGIGSGRVLNVKDKDGELIGSFTTGANTTFGELFNAIAAYGMDGDLNEGRVTFVHNYGGYVDGTLASDLGVTTTYNTVTTNRTVGSQTTGTLKQYSETDYATNDNKLSDFGLSGTLNIKDKDGNLLHEFTYSGDETFADVFNDIAAYGMDGDLNEGRVTFVHNYGGYVDGTLATALGVGTSYTTVTTTTTVGATQSTGSFSYSTTYAADENTTFAQMGLDGTRAYTINRGSTGEEPVNLNVTGSTTVGQFFRAIGDYGIQGTINDGVILLQSDTEHYITGNLAAALGIGTYNYTQTVHGTTTGDLNVSGLVTINATDTIEVDVTRTVDTSSTGWVTIDATDTVTVDVTTTQTVAASGFVTVSVSDTVTVNIAQTLTVTNTGTRTISVEDTVTLNVSQTHTVTSTTTTVVTAYSTISCLTTANGTVLADRDTNIFTACTLNRPIPSNAAIDYQIFVHNASGYGIATVSLTATSTFGDMFDALDDYDIQGVISDGVVSFTSNNGHYLTDMGDVYDYDDSEYVGILYLIGVTNDEGDANTCTVTITVQTSKTSSAAVTYTEDVEKNTSTATVYAQVEAVNATDIQNIFLDGKHVDGTITKSTTSLSGSVFAIGTAGGLAKLRDLVNSGTSVNGKTFFLTSDIDLSMYNWVSIGTVDHAFSGATFDGMGHTIKNLYQTVTSASTRTETHLAGLFGKTEYATIENVNIDNAQIKIDAGIDTAQAGVLASNFRNGTIKNVTTQGSININNRWDNSTVIGGAAGGIVGISSWSSISSEIANCSSDVDIYQTQSTSNRLPNFYVGGIIGSAASTNINGCEVKHGYEISCTELGGIVGLYFMEANRNSAITNCKVLNNITNSSGNAGGIVGRVLGNNDTNNGSPVTTLSISNNIFSDIAETDTGYCGAVIGATAYYDNTRYANIQISNCFQTYEENDFIYNNECPSIMHVVVNNCRYIEDSAELQNAKELANFDSSVWGYGNAQISKKANELVLVNPHTSTTSITFTATNATTISNVISFLTSQGVEATLDNGQLMISNTNGYVISGGLANNLGIKSIDSNNVNTTKTLKGSQIINYGTKLGNLTLTSNVTPSFMLKENFNADPPYWEDTVEITLSSEAALTDLFTALEEYDIYGSVENGKVTLQSKGDWSFFGSNTNLKLSYSTAVTITETGTLTTDTTFAKLGLGNADLWVTDVKQYRTTGGEPLSARTYNITMRASNTVGDFVEKLSAYGIDANVVNGKFRINDNYTAGAYISYMNTSMKSALNLSGSFTGTSSITQYYNKNSDELHVQGIVNVMNTFTLTSTQTLTITATDTITVNINKTETVSATQTITLDNTGTTTVNVTKTYTVSDTQTCAVDTTGYTTVNIAQTLTINATQTAWVETTGSNTINIKQTIVIGATQTTSVNSTGTVTIDLTSTRTIIANDTSDRQIYVSTSVMNAQTKFSNLGAAYNQNSTISVNYEGVAYDITMLASNTIGDMLTALAGFGISGNVQNGSINLQGTSDGYITAVNGAAYTLGLRANFSTSENTVVNGSNTAGSEKQRTLTYNMDGNTKINEINGLTNRTGTINVQYMGQDYAVTINGETTIDGLIGMLAAYGVEAACSNGVMTFNGTKNGYIMSANGVATELGAATATVVSSTTVVEGTNTAGSEKARTITHTMSGTTTLGDLDLGEGKFFVNYHGTDYTVSVNSDTTIDGLIGMLAAYGVEAVCSNGIMTFNGTNSGYITNATGSAATLGASQAYSTSTSQVINGENTAGTYKARTLTFNMDGTTTFAQLNLGAGTATVQYGGRNHTISMNANNTMDDFLTALAGVGITGSISNGVMTLEGTYDGMILGTTGGIYDLGLRAAYATTTTTTTYGSDSTSTYMVRTTSPTMLRSTKLADLQDSDGNNLGITTGSFYVYSNGVRNVETITEDTTVEDLMSTMSRHGLITEYDSDGALSVSGYNNTYLETSSLMGANSNVVERLFSTWDFTKVYDSNHLEIPTAVVEAISRDTKLSDIAEGEYQSGAVTIIKNGVQTNLMLTDNDTVGTFLDELSMFGFESVVNDNGQIIIRNTGDGVLKAYTGADQASNILDIIGANTNDWILTKSYESSAQNVITQTVLYNNATEATKLSELASDYTGTLEVYIDGQRNLVDVSADETVGSLLSKFRAMGLEASIAGGQITVQSGFKELSMTEYGTTANATSKLASSGSALGLNFKQDLGNYLASNNSIQSTTTITEDVTLSVSNDAGLNTKFSLLNITDGSLTLYHDGQKAVFRIGENSATGENIDTLGKLLTKIQQRYSDVDFKHNEDGSLLNGYLTIYSKTGANIEVGSTTDTSNFASITGIAKNDKGLVESARELYCVNNESVVTADGLFRRGNVTEGIFTVGDAIITIDSNTTLQNIVSQINSNSDKSRAHAYWDNIKGELVIEALDTGSTFVNIEAGTSDSEYLANHLGVKASNFTDIMGYTTSTLTDTGSILQNSDGSVFNTRMNTTVQQLGQNAKFKINGTSYTSTSNKIESDVSRIAGVTINLKGTSEGETVTLDVKRDTETLSNAVQEVVDSYNDLMENVDKAIAKGGSLATESTLKMIRNQLKNLMTSSVAGSTVFKNLDAIGISVAAATGTNVSTDNSAIVKMNFDTSKFAKAFDSDQAALKSLLVGIGDNKGTGVFDKLENIVENALSSTGYFTTADKSYSKQITTLNEKIRKANQAAERYKAQLENKFKTMDMLISKMNQQYSSFLK